MFFIRITNQKIIAMQSKKHWIQSIEIRKIHKNSNFSKEENTVLFLWKIIQLLSIKFLCIGLNDDCVCFPIFQERFKNIPIVPVPPRPNKIAEKGWDQIEDLVWILEKKYKLKICRLLERTTKIQQKKLGKEDRLSESKHSYVAKTVKNRKIPKEIVLLDDVITTGSTINSCKEVLLSLGVEKIHCVSLFIVP